MMDVELPELDLVTGFVILVIVFLVTMIGFLGVSGLFTSVEVKTKESLNGPLPTLPIAYKTAIGPYRLQEHQYSLSMKNKRFSNRLSKRSSDRLSVTPNLDDLNSDILEHLTTFLDTNSALSLFTVNKSLNQRLLPCSAFWKYLCTKEGFKDIDSLKTEDDNGAQKLAWNGENLHDVKIPEDATLWHTIFLKGSQMRRNMIGGRYQLWRLFMTDENSLPVQKMSQDTSFRELISNIRERISNISTNPYSKRLKYASNEEYLIAIQHHGNFHQIFVWKVGVLNTPEFLYSFDMSLLYPLQLFSQSFFLYKNYFVLMPEASCFAEGPIKSIIRVHNVADNMALVGSYDFPENGLSRHRNFGEFDHLFNLGDKAVALCRTPLFTFFIFSLPTCKLLYQIPCLSSLERPLELDESCKIDKIDNTVMVEFQDPEDEDEKYRRLLIVDFDKVIKNGGPLEQRINNRFSSDAEDDQIFKLSLISKYKMVYITFSGKIVIIDIIETSNTTVTFDERLSIPCPDTLLHGDGMTFNVSQSKEVIMDGTTFVVSQSKEVIVVMRRFVSGRKMHAYSFKGSLLYTINLDASELNWESPSGCTYMNMNDHFLCASDKNKVVLWNNRNGKLMNIIPIVKPPSQMWDVGGWNGHHSLRLNNDSIMILQNRKNYFINFW